MKRKSSRILSGMALCLLASCAQPDKGFVINGQIEDAAEGIVYLKKYEDKSYSDVDSAVIENGRFRFEGKAAEVQAYALTTQKDTRHPLLFFMGNDAMEIRLNESEKEIEVKGSASHDLYAANAPLIRNKHYNLDSLINLYPQSPVGAFFLMRDRSGQLNLEQLKQKRALFDAALNGSFYMDQIDKLIAKLEHIQPGQTAPDFTLPDTDGNLVSLSSFRGQYVLMDFWASWCPDCRRENPAVVALYQQYKEKNFTVLGVSLDRSREPWLKAIEKDGLTWTHVSDVKGWQSEPAQLYAIRWIPTTYLLDTEGKIILVATDIKQIKEKLAEIFPAK